MSDLSRLTQIVGRLPEELQAARRRGVAGGALHVTRAIRAQVKADTGDMRLSGVGRRGAKVGAKYTMRGGTDPSAMVKATGPMQLLEHDTKPHRIAPRKRRGQAKGRALRLADGSFVAAVDHPGTTAKRPFERGYLESRGDTGRIFDAEVQKAIRQALR